jgi:hypothetical protein
MSNKQLRVSEIKSRTKENRMFNEYSSSSFPIVRCLSSGVCSLSRVMAGTSQGIGWVIVPFQAWGWAVPQVPGLRDSSVGDLCGRSFRTVVSAVTSQTSHWNRVGVRPSLLLCNGSGGQLKCLSVVEGCSLWSQDFQILCVPHGSIQAGHMGVVTEVMTFVKG